MHASKQTTMASSLKLVKVHQGEGELLLPGEPLPIPVRYEIREYDRKIEPSTEAQTLPRSTQGRVIHPEGHRGWHPIVLVSNTSVTLVLNNGRRIDAILESADGLLGGGPIY